MKTHPAAHAADAAKRYQSRPTSPRAHPGSDPYRMSVSGAAHAASAASLIFGRVSPPGGNQHPEENEPLIMTESE